MNVTQALNFNKNNVKAWFRLAKAHQMLQNWEEAGDAIDAGLAVPGEAENKDLLKLQQLLNAKVRKARQARQERERKRAERVASVKLVWKHCKSNGIQLGRVPLVATVSDEDDEGGANDVDESRWHHHHPHTGQLPVCVNSNNSDWSWPCMFVYPSHGQSDFVKHFGENEMLAYRMADMFPELEKEGEETVMPWDYNNEFRCSNLAVYFEVNCDGSDNNNDKQQQQKIVNHPDSVERLEDQGATMKFYEASRALKGDEGPDMQNLVQAVERKRLHKQRKAWKKKHGSLWARPDPADVVRVHPAMTLRDALTDSRMVVANVSFSRGPIPCRSCRCVELISNSHLVIIFGLR
jgi:Cns1/TTC4 Wheel domain